MIILYLVNTLDSNEKNSKFWFVLPLTPHKTRCPHDEKACLHETSCTKRFLSLEKNSVINSVCDMGRLTVLIQTTPNLYKMCGACAVC